MNYKEYLPSKEFTKRVSSLALIALGFFILYIGGAKLIEYFSSKSSNNEAMPTVVVKDILEQDRDQDGLKDWEEGLWEMDPEKADTDGDGILDGVEANTKREALVASQESGISGSELSLNETDQFIEELLITASAVGQAGNITEAGAMSLTDPVFDKIKNLQISNPYLLKDIKVSNNASLADIFAYAKKLDALVKKYPLSKDVSLLVVKRSFDTKDTTYLDRLLPILDNYKKIIAGLVATSVPKPLAEKHLTLINGYLLMHDSVKSFQTTYENPVKALAVVLQYTKNIDVLKSATEALLSELEKYEASDSRNRS